MAHSIRAFLVLTVLLGGLAMLSSCGSMGSGSAGSTGPGVVAAPPASGSNGLTHIAFGDSIRGPAPPSLSTGDILITDGKGVVRIDPATGVQSLYAANASAGGILINPLGIVVDGVGNVYVTDTGILPWDGNPAHPGSAVVRISPNGTQTVISQGNNFRAPFGIAIDGNGQLVVADAWRPGVIRVDPASGAQTVVFSGSPYANPDGIAVDTDGSLIVVDPNSSPGGGPGAVFRQNPAGGAPSMIGPRFGADPQGVALKAGLIYVMDPNTDTLWKVDPTTGSQTPFSSGNLFLSPAGVAVEAAGTFVVADGNPVLQSVFRVAASGSQSVLSRDNATQGNLLANEGPEGIVVVPTLVTYTVSPLYDQTKAVHKGAVLPIKLQLLNSAGANVSSASIVVHATVADLVSTSTSVDVQAVGGANPDNDFRFDPTVGTSGGYIFNLATSPLASGTWTLSFTATGDGTTHTVQFQVK